MENPATWGRAEHVVQDTLTAVADEMSERGLEDYRIGLSMARRITDALREAGLLPVVQEPAAVVQHLHLLGKRVRVHLDDKTVVTGRLLGFGDTGEFEIDDGNGTIHYCWPMLSIEEAQ